MPSVAVLNVGQVVLSGSRVYVVVCLAGSEMCYVDGAGGAGGWPLHRISLRWRPECCSCVFTVE